MRVLLAGAAAVITLSSLSACSTTTNGKPTGVASQSSSTSGTETTSPSSGSSAGGSLGEDAARHALLTVDEVGSTFTTGTFEQDDNPLPCAKADAPSFAKQTSPQVDVGAEFDSDNPQAQVGEEIYSYPDAAAASGALAVGKAGMDCTKGTIHYTDGTTATVTIGKPETVSDQLDVDSGYAWSVDSDEFSGSQVAFVVGAELITLTFAAATDVDTTKLPDAIKIARTAISKVKSE
jgi:hypothetical protein